LASLRSSTRADRSRALPDHDPEDDNKPKGKKAPLERKTSRPFFPFTQVCQQIRSEFYPIYLGSQEIGLDLNDVIPYLLTVYNKETLSEEQLKMKDRPFKGNLTIAINGRVLSIEKDGVQIIELLILWANSVKMEAGFGRYSVIGYNPHTDGEAKDMYVNLPTSVKNLMLIFLKVSTFRPLRPLRPHLQQHEQALAEVSPRQRARIRDHTPRPATSYGTVPAVLRLHRCSRCPSSYHRPSHPHEPAPVLPHLVQAVVRRALDALR